MIRNNIATLLTIALSVSLLSCDRESNITTPGSTDYSSRIEAQVIANCLTVQAAAEEFAERNNGVFAVDFDTDTNLDDNTIFDLLPLKKLLINPVSSRKTGIINDQAAYPGETGYQGWGSGFRITSINEAGYYIINYRWRPAL